MTSGRAGTSGSLGVTSGREVTSGSLGESLPVVMSLPVDWRGTSGCEVTSGRAVTSRDLGTSYKIGHVTV